MAGVGVCEDTIQYAYMNKMLAVLVGTCLLVIINAKKTIYGMILTEYRVSITYE